MIALRRAWAWLQWRLGFTIPSLNTAFYALKQEHYVKMVAAKKTGNEAEVAMVRNAFEPVISFHVERINFHNSQELIEKATLYQLSIPAPPEAGGTNDFWTQGSYGRIMTERGFEDLRPRVRAHEKERREARLAWAAWIGALTGLVGALTGLVAVLKG